MYYSQIRVDPTNPADRLPGRRAVLQDRSTAARPGAQVGGIAHSDHHAIWINPRNNKHILLGNDGGLDVSYDQGETWEYVNTDAARAVLRGQRRHAEAVHRLRRPAGQRQLVRPERHAHRATASSTPTGSASAAATASTPQNDPTDWATIYWESQDGATSRSDLRTGRSTSIRPRPAAPGRTRRRWRRRAGCGRRDRSVARAAAHRAIRRRRTERRARASARNGSIASTGARRSSCRRTIPAPSISARIACSGRTTAATPGRRRRI